MNQQSWLSLLFVSMLFAISCERGVELSTPGDLVPQTVGEDRTIPAISVNGTLLHAEAFGNPSDPMILFLHGGPGSDYRSALNVRHLVDSGYLVVFFDQRGTGLSTRHTSAIYSIELYLADISAVIEHYRSSDSQEVYLFGHSWGAMLTAAYLNRYPDRIDGAILAEPGGLNKQLLDEYAASSRQLNLFGEATHDVLYFEQILGERPDDHALLDYRMSLSASFAYAEGNAEGNPGPFPFWRNGAVVLNAFVEIAENEGFDFTTDLDQVDIPVLFIYGENNPSYGREFAEREAAFFPEAQIEQIDDAGHEMIYFNWPAVSPVVLAYLTSL
ncbi:alpha/beta hydrolase [Pontibacter sp. G13]|uniref:alpha/beta fold hydrolase n=1 Tax=Pontibacter sp. G13 TaxID=3074898 RepID=UPI00288A308C|nr:alpha/beta hydrolase [Pontibacter sp. G13]WNJ19036.1 alpha/beta hydrolase [Pontibacter sp. G13]